MKNPNQANPKSNRTRPEYRSHTGPPAQTEKPVCTASPLCEGFVGIDREGKPRHIHKRSTAAQGSFKGNAPGSEPEYSFHWVGGGETLFLFEAPIDMLSFISMHKQHWKSSSYAAACGVSDKVLWKTMEGRPFIRNVCICLDNDETGQRVAQRISKALTEKNIQNQILVPIRKDWNEDLLFLRKEDRK